MVDEIERMIFTSSVCAHSGNKLGARAHGSFVTVPKGRPYGTSRLSLPVVPTTPYGTTHVSLLTGREILCGTASVALQVDFSQLGLECLDVSRHAVANHHGPDPERSSIGTRSVI